MGASEEGVLILNEEKKNKNKNNKHLNFSQNGPMFLKKKKKKFPKCQEKSHPGNRSREIQKSGGIA